MISLIICSRTPIVPESLVLNIKESIGIAYEIISVDNSQNQYSIFEAYNLGIKRSRFSYLCFIHDDILFYTPNWGEVLVKLFNLIPNLGCIGIAGATHKTKAPSGWWDVPKTESVLHLVEHVKNKSKKFISEGWADNEQYKEVAVVDGVFMAVKKSDNLQFDESIRGFHGYDLNLSLEAIKKGLKNIISKEILLEHFSQGTINQNWVLATHAVHQKYAALLPVSVSNRVKNNKLEIINLERFIEQALKLGLKHIALFYWLRFIKLKPIAKPHVKILIKLLRK